jgi:hypothetical protein
MTTRVITKVHYPEGVRKQRTLCTLKLRGTMQVTSERQNVTCLTCLRLLRDFYPVEESAHAS